MVAMHRISNIIMCLYVFVSRILILLFPTYRYRLHCIINA